MLIEVLEDTARRERICRRRRIDRTQPARLETVRADILGSLVGRLCGA